LELSYSRTLPARDLAERHHPRERLVRPRVPVAERVDPARDREVAVLRGDAELILAILSLSEEVDLVMIDQRFANFRVVIGDIVANLQLAGGVRIRPLRQAVPPIQSILPDAPIEAEPRLALLRLRVFPPGDPRMGCQIPGRLPRPGVPADDQAGRAGIGPIAVLEREEKLTPLLALIGQALCFACIGKNRRL